jgi:hypothetical protein
MKRDDLFLLVVLLSACNAGSQQTMRSIQQQADIVEYPEVCYTEFPADVSHVIEKSLIDNRAARDKAVAAEQDRLGVKPLKPTTILGRIPAGTSEFKPVVDPFPESIVAVGALNYDIRKSGYQLNHGEMGKENVYETSPGSGQFFIVDLIDGDGIGGNGREVIVTSIEYGLLDFSSNLDGHSWHSWHVSSDNVLIRAKQRPDDSIIKEIPLCGCGSLEEVVALANADRVAPPSYHVAIFMLPASNLPRISTDTFEARYSRSYVKQKFVPSLGKTCKAPADGNVAC